MIIEYLQDHHAPIDQIGSEALWSVTDVFSATFGRA